MNTEQELREKMNQLAILIADDLLKEGATLGDRIDGLKTLSGHYATMDKHAGSGGKAPNGRWSALSDRINGGMTDDEAD